MADVDIVGDAPRVFSGNLRPSAGTRARLEELLARLDPAEREAWLRYGLTWSDEAVGRKEVSWDQMVAVMHEFSLMTRERLRGVAADLALVVDRPSAAPAESEEAVLNCAWMDNSTLGAALDLLLRDGQWLSPLTFLDLDSVLRSIALYDHVFHIPGVEDGTDALNAALQERVFVPINLDQKIPAAPTESAQASGTVAAAMYSLFWQVNAPLQRTPRSPLEWEFRAILVEGWEKLLGRSISATNFEVAFDAGWSSPVDVLVRELASIGAWRRESGSPLDTSADLGVMDIHHLVSQSTARALFNTELARAMQLPYVPSVARLPAQRAIAAQQRRATEYVSLDGFVDREIRESLRSLDANSAVLHLPSFTSAVLNLAGDGSLVDGIAELRFRTRHLRAHRAELEYALNDSSSTGATRDSLRAAIAKDADSINQAWAWAGAGVGVASLWIGIAFASPIPMTLNAVVGLATLAVQGREAWEGFNRRLRRPYERQLADLRTTTRDLGYALPALQRRWEAPYDSTWEEFSAELGRLTSQPI